MSEPYSPCTIGCCDCPTLLPCTPNTFWLQDTINAAERRGYERAKAELAATPPDTLT